MGKEHPPSTVELWGTSGRSDPMEQRLLWKKRISAERNIPWALDHPGSTFQALGGRESSRLWLSVVTLENSFGAAKILLAIPMFPLACTWSCGGLGMPWKTSPTPAGRRIPAGIQPLQKNTLKCLFCLGDTASGQQIPFALLLPITDELGFWA